MSTLVLGRTPRQQPQAVRELWVAGVGGGVGTTTMVALVAAYLDALHVGCAVADHWGGGVAGRLAAAGAVLPGTVPALPETTFGPAHGAVRLTLVDAGQAGARLVDVFQRTDGAVCLVAPPTPDGAGELSTIRSALEAHTSPGRVQALLCDALAVPRETSHRALELASPAGFVPYLRPLSAPGPLPVAQLRGALTTAALQAIAALLHMALVS